MSDQGSQEEPRDGAEPPPGPSPTVVAWGDDRPDGGRRPRLWSVAHDRRLVPMTVALGALAVLLSLLSEWQITVVRFDEGEVTDRPLPARIDDLAGWASGYLVGLLLLTAATVLLLYGPRAVRRPARLVALSTGGLLLAMLAAIVSDLRERSELNSLLELTLDKDQIGVTYGRGLWCAVVGVAAVTLGAYLAGRHLPADQTSGRPVTAGAASANDTHPNGTGPDAPGPDAPGPDGTGPNGTGPDSPAGDPDVDFSWRRPPRNTPPGVAPYDDEPPDAPLGLTVEPTTPFSRQLDDRDRPA